MTMPRTEDTAVLDALRDSLDGVAMRTPAADIVEAGRTRVRRRRLARGATGALAVAALALTVTPLAHRPAGSPLADAPAGPVAFTLARHPDGTIHVTWDKQRYFQDRAGLEHALRQAGFPVVIKEGEFCAGPGDDTSLDPSGTGPGVDAVVTGRTESDGRVTFVYTPAAMPPGKQLFIGYLSAAQLAITHGRPGSVERLVSATGPLTCTTEAPPANPRPPVPGR